MPSVSKKQHNFMAAVAKNPQFAKKAGVPTSVGAEFLQADKGKKFRGGGMADKKDPRYAQKEYIAGGEDGGWAENDVTYGGKKVMENVPEGYANEMQRELGRAKTMQQVNNPKTVSKKCGGSVKKMASGGSVRGCGCAVKGKTKGRMV